MPISNINLGVYNALVDTDVQDAVYSIHGIQDSLYTYDGSLNYVDAITGTNAYGGEVFAVNPSSTFLYVGSGRDILYYELADEYLPVYRGKVSSVVPSGKYIQSMVVPPGGGHIYIGVNGPNVYQADVSASTGLVTNVSSTSISTNTLTSVVSIVSSWDSKFLYILGGTSSTNGQNVWVYRRDKTTGVLTAVQTNNITHGGIVPRDLKVSPDGSMLAVAFASEIYIYNINTTYGRLSYNSKHSKGTRSIHSIVFGADGKYLYAGANGGKVYMYESNVFNGVVQTVDTGASEALKVSMNYAGTALYAGESTGDTLYKFIVSPLSGQLTASTNTDVPKTNISSIIMNTSGMLPKSYFSQYINTTTMSTNFLIAQDNNIRLYDESGNLLMALSSGVTGVTGDYYMSMVPGTRYFLAYQQSGKRVMLCKFSEDYNSISKVTHTDISSDIVNPGAITFNGKFFYCTITNRVVCLPINVDSETLGTPVYTFATDSKLSKVGRLVVTTNDEYIVMRGKSDYVSFKIDSSTGAISNQQSSADTLSDPNSYINLSPGPGSNVAVFEESTGVINIYEASDAQLNTVTSISASGSISGTSANEPIVWYQGGNHIYYMHGDNKIYHASYDASSGTLTGSASEKIDLRVPNNYVVPSKGWKLSADHVSKCLYVIPIGSRTNAFKLEIDESTGDLTLTNTIPIDQTPDDGLIINENKISVNSTTTSMASTAVTNVSPHAEIYLGTGVFDAADATELVPGVPLGVPDLTAIRYAAEIDFTGAELCDLLANVAIKVSREDIDFINADPDRIDSVIAYQTAGAKSFDMKELGNLGTKNATLSGDFDLGEGNDIVKVGGDVGDLGIDMSATSNVLAAAAVLPKAIGSAMQLTGGKEEIYRVMVNEADFVNLAKFADDSQGATDSAGSTVKLQDLLRAADSAVGAELQVSEITTDASKAMAERKVGHEILLNMFRLSPPRPGPNGATNDDTFTGDANGYWTYDGDDLLKLSKLPEDVNLQFVLKTSQDIVDSLGAKIIGTQSTPSGAVSGLEASVDAGRVYVLFNFKFAKQ